MDGMYNLAGCLEYRKGTDGDLHGAGKYYRLSVEQKNAAAQNSLPLPARVYQRAVDPGHADGAHTLLFCLLLGRGVGQSIDSAAENYKIAADRGHPEAKLNLTVCLRLLAR
jgi:TPR repeat protein